MEVEVLEETDRSGSDSEQKENTPVFVVELIPLHYTRDVGTYNRSRTAQTLQHTKASEKTVAFRCMSSRRKPILLIWAIRATEKYPSYQLGSSGREDCCYR